MALGRSLWALKALCLQLLKENELREDEKKQLAATKTRQYIGSRSSPARVLSSNGHTFIKAEAGVLRAQFMDWEVYRMRLPNPSGSHRAAGAQKDQWLDASASSPQHLRITRRRLDRSHFCFGRHARVRQKAVTPRQSDTMACEDHVTLETACEAGKVPHLDERKFQVAHLHFRAVMG